MILLTNPSRPKLICLKIHLLLFRDIFYIDIFRVNHKNCNKKKSRNVLYVRSIIIVTRISHTLSSNSGEKNLRETLTQSVQPCDAAQNSALLCHNCIIKASASFCQWKQPEYMIDRVSFPRINISLCFRWVQRSSSPSLKTDFSSPSWRTFIYFLPVMSRWPG